MISGQAFLIENGLYAIGDGSEGDTFVFTSTGLTVNGQTLFKLVPGAAAGADLLVDDDSGEILFDDDTGDVLYDG